MREFGGEAVPSIIKKQRIAICFTVLMLIATLATLVGLLASHCLDGCYLSKPRYISCKKNSIEYCCQLDVYSSQPIFCGVFNDCIKY